MIILAEVLIASILQRLNRKLLIYTNKYGVITIIEPQAPCREFFTAKFEELEADVFSQHRAAFPAEAFNLRNLVWAGSFVRSKIFPPLEGEQAAIVPLADLVQTRFSRCSFVCGTAKGSSQSLNKRRSSFAIICEDGWGLYEVCAVRLQHVTIY